MTESSELRGEESEALEDETDWQNMAAALEMERDELKAERDTLQRKWSAIMERPTKKGSQMRFERDEAKRQLRHAENNFLRLSKEFNILKRELMDLKFSSPSVPEPPNDAIHSFSNIEDAIAWLYEPELSSAPTGLTRDEFDGIARWLRQQVRLLESLPSEPVCYDAGCIYEHPHPKHDPPVEHPAAAALAQIATLVRDTPLYIFEDDSAAENFRDEIAAILESSSAPTPEMEK
jgi:hypothetical protein